MNATASATFEASMPRRLNRYRMTCIGFSASTMVTDVGVCSTKPAARWSCRLAPTFGEAATTGTPTLVSWSGSPMPDSISRCGEPIAPAERMTSRLAVTWWLVPASSR